MYKKKSRKSVLFSDHMHLSYCACANCLVFDLVQSSKKTIYTHATCTLWHLVSNLQLLFQDNFVNNKIFLCVSLMQPKCFMHIMLEDPLVISEVICYIFKTLCIMKLKHMTCANKFVDAD